jgi:hypothetical protein
MSSPKNPHAMAYFQEAIAYYIAANKLREIMTTQPPSGLPLRIQLTFSTIIPPN